MADIGSAAPPSPHAEAELPDVLDARRYRTVDRDGNKWYLSVSELDGRPVEIFASTAFDRDHELQSRIANLTTITRLLSMALRHISLGEPLTYDKCVTQVQRSSRQKNDLPDMLASVLARYGATPAPLYVGSMSVCFPPVRYTGGPRWRGKVNL